MREEELVQIGKMIAEESRAQEDPEHPLNKRRVLQHADSEDVRHWVRLWLQEVQNAILAHMTVYNGNPAGYAEESSWGALQLIVNELSTYTVSLIDGANRFEIPTPVFNAARIIREYALLSAKYPLVLSGYATKNDCAVYAKLLTTTIKYVVYCMGTDPDNAIRLWNEWQKQRFGI